MSEGRQDFWITSASSRPPTTAGARRRSTRRTVVCAGCSVDCGRTSRHWMIQFRDPIIQCLEVLPQSTEQPAQTTVRRVERRLAPAVVGGLDEALVIQKSCRPSDIYQPLEPTYLADSI